MRELISITEKKGYKTWCVSRPSPQIMASGAAFQYSEPEAGRHLGFRLYMRNVTLAQHTFIEGLALG